MIRQWSVMTNSERRALWESLPQEQREFRGTHSDFINKFGDEAFTAMLRSTAGVSENEEAQELARRSGEIPAPEWWCAPS